MRQIFDKDGDGIMTKEELRQGTHDLVGDVVQTQRRSVLHDAAKGKKAYNKA